MKFIPATLEAGLFYVSPKYKTSMHLCACGCGSDISLPISAAGWTITSRHGLTVRPSVGNWSYACRSHYYITDGEVEWLTQMSAQAIAANRRHDDYVREEVHASPSITWLQRVVGAITRLIGSPRRFIERRRRRDS